jgi:hypothetical protein
MSIQPPVRLGVIKDLELDNKVNALDERTGERWNVKVRSGILATPPVLASRERRERTSVSVVTGREYETGELPKCIWDAMCRGRSKDEIAHEWAEWLSGQGLNVYVTLTWSDDAADERHIDSPTSALRDFRALMRKFKVRKYYVAVEGHKERTVPHIHAVIRYDGSMKAMWEYYWNTRHSMARILPVMDGCFSYVAKYIMKDKTDTGGLTTEWRL